MPLTPDALPPGLLLDTFRAGWTIEISGVPPSPDMARSPLQPFFVRAVKAELAGASHGIRSLLKPSPKAPNSEQLAEACQVSHSSCHTPSPRFNSHDLTP